MVGVTLPKEDTSTTEEHLNELALLAKTKELDVIKSFSQRLDLINQKTYIGKGKAEEIKDFIQAHAIDLVLFDDNLRPSQVRNLENLWNCTLWDRSFLILEIFAMRAKSAEAKLQVELAQYQYLLPRLRGMWSHHSRQKGGSSQMKGPGEQELETDKRMAKKRIARLKKRLKIVEQQTKTKRKQRGKKVNVALVGYTNAGKSTLMNVLAKESVKEENKLFSTLETTVRKTSALGIPFLLSDTVGFIRKLPHTLIESFKSTLMEVKEADLILHVVDGAHPHFKEHILVVQKTLEEIGADQIPSLLVLNKADKIIEKEKAPIVNFSVDLGQQSKAKKISISALKKEGIDALKSAIKEQIEKTHLAIYPNGILP